MIRLCLLILLSLSGLANAQKRKTTVSIKGEYFYLNNEITLKGKTYNRMRLEGLLPNLREARVR